MTNIPSPSGRAASGSIRQRWRTLSPRTRTLLSLALWILAWQAVLADGKPLVVNLWATWCPPCRREMPVLAAAQQRETGVNFVFANQAESRATVMRYLTTSQLDLANVTLDRYSELGNVAGSGILPATLFYDGSGRLVDTYLGELSAATLEKKLTQLRPH